jgi:Icc-related predicted phosphoesterase
VISEQEAVKILAVSDVVQPQLHNVDYLRQAYGGVDVLVSCGDLPIHYLDFLGTTLSVPLLFVRGNHDISYAVSPPGGDNLHLRFVRYHGYLFAGLEGSIAYNKGPAQYTDQEMMVRVLRLLPRMMIRRLWAGYGVHVLVAHSPPRGIHDLPDDRAHRGFAAFRTLIRLGRPMYLLHGHVDTWDRRRTRQTVYLGTTVLNVNPYMLIDIG